MCERIHYKGEDSNYKVDNGVNFNNIQNWRLVSYEKIYLGLSLSINNIAFFL